MKKRITAILLAAFMLVGVLAGCGAPAEKGNGDEAPVEKAPEARANEITVGIANDLAESLDPHTPGSSAGTREIMFNVFEGLMKPTPEGELVPAVAESVEVSEDQLTYTFTLREGVKYHNGESVTAEDVVYSIERCSTPNEAGLVAEPALGIIEKIEALDERSVALTLSQPDGEFLNYMTAAIVPADYKDQAAAPVGTGPFKYVSRTAQDSVVIEKFDEYWGEAAFLDKVTFKIIENADSMVLSLQSGAIDFCNHLPTVQAAQLGEDFQIVEGAMALVQALYINNSAAPFDNELVRQALCYGTDRQQIIDLAFDGYGSIVGSSMYPALSRYFDESLVDIYPYDTKKAKALLAEAGYPDGFSMTITVPSNYSQHVDTAQVIANQYKEIGINVELQPVEWATWVSDVYKGRNFQTTITGLDAHTMTARAMLERFQSQHGKNFINYTSEEYDSLLAEAMAAVDESERTELYNKAQRDMAEHAANVYIQAPADLVAVRKGLEGVRFYPIYALDMAGLHWAE